jgi:mono/diheme cytochrome c family protein
MRHGASLLAFALLACAAWGAACSAGGSNSTPTVPTSNGNPDAGSGVDAAPDVMDCPWNAGVPIPADVQRTGDPQKGYSALVNNDYIGCGIPYSVYSTFFGPAPANQQLPGRTGVNAQLPYNYTAFKATSGVELVTANCLTCHAGWINGKLVVGLGAANADFTTDPSAEAKAVGSFVTNPAEKVEWQKWADRVEAVGPYTVTQTVGQNPADNLAAVLFAHRDPKTLAWSDTPLLALPAQGQVVPVDVPPWWRMKKKNAMFYNAAGRGDHARIMMTASTLCTDTVALAQAIDAYFPDVEAFITSIQPPAYPFPIDQALAAQGHDVFAFHCSPCHGVYGSTTTYPNLLLPVEVVGTDSTLAAGSAQFAQAYVNWFNTSWYGQVAQLSPSAGYVAPPLDGIWATAPYLHNGSVPTIGALLDSKTRPQYWTRTFDSTDYDQVNVGWNFTAVDHGQAAEPNPTTKKKIYDTTLLGAGNSGHTFGDTLSTTDRTAVIEYLKTL